MVNVCGLFGDDKHMLISNYLWDDARFAHYQANLRPLPRFARRVLGSEPRTRQTKYLPCGRYFVWRAIVLAIATEITSADTSYLLRIKA